MSDASEYAALCSGALLVDRSDRVRIRFGGQRAAELLTGLVTNDVLSLVAGHGQYAAALTPKGKIAADVRIFADDEGLLTDTSARASTGWRDIVTKYINPRIAPYRDVTAETLDIGVFGPKSRRVVAIATGADEAALEALHPYAHVTVDLPGGKAKVIRVAEIDAEGYEIIGPAASEQPLREKLFSAGAIPGSAQAWDIARIEAGRPEWGIDMNDATIPQEANFDALGAISYTKGCYTGQETVARVHFRGHVNRFLRRLHFVSAAIPPTNAELVDDAGNVVGDVRSVAMSPRHGGVALAMVRREVAPGTTLHARWDGGECTVQIAAQEKDATG
ncbi:MAG: glycine cleavage T C-terminal barrel domain-containing protein [Gemmatimonadaceae bacterium]|nr:glycine cleavage T C-terminal barrel domain-containing protein [Gemmatimonadaceae bacterium]